MQFGKIVVHKLDNYNFTKFHQNEMKNKKVLLIARFSVSKSMAYDNVGTPNKPCNNHYRRKFNLG